MEAALSEHSGFQISKTVRCLGRTLYDNYYICANYNLSDWKLQTHTKAYDRN